MSVYESNVQKEKSKLAEELYAALTADTTLQHTDILKTTPRESDADPLRFSFVDAYKRKIGESTAEAKPEMTVAPPGPDPSIFARKAVKDMHKANALEFERQQRVSTYFDKQASAYEQRLNDTEFQAQIEIPEIDLTEVSDTAADEKNKLSWIKTKFVAWENDQDAIEAQMSIANMLNDSYEALAFERAREPRDEQKIKALSVITARLAACAEGYAQNERELYIASNEAAAELYTDDGDDIDPKDRATVRDNVIQMSLEARKEVRQLIFDEAAKLTAFTICATKPVEIKSPSDTSYLTSLGVDVAEFNQFKRSDMKMTTISEANADFERLTDELFTDVTLNDEFLGRFETALSDRNLTDEQRDKLMERLEVEIKQDSVTASIDTNKGITESESSTAIENVNSLAGMASDTRANLLCKWRKQGTSTPPELVTETRPDLRSEKYTERMLLAKQTLNQNRTTAHTQHMTSLDEACQKLRLSEYRRTILYASNPERKSTESLSALDEQLRQNIAIHEMRRMHELIDTNNMESRKRLHEILVSNIPEDERSIFDHAMKRLITDGQELSADDKSLLTAASDYALTDTDAAVLEQEMSEASQKALSAMEKELKGFEEKIADGKKESIMEFGGHLSALRDRAEHAMTHEHSAQFSAGITTAMEAALPAYKKELLTNQELEAEAGSPLARLLVAADLNPSIAHALNQQTPQKQAELITAIASNDGIAAINAADELMRPYPEMDEACLELKSKILQGGLKPEGDWQVQPESEFAVEAKHLSGRAARLLRTKIETTTSKMELGDPRRTAGDEYRKLSDKQLLEGLLSHDIAGKTGDKKLENESLLYIRAYALVIAGETGSIPSAEALAKQECLKGYEQATIDSALKTDIDTEKNLSSAQETIAKQREVYDTTRFGNRALNVIGDLVDRDLSTERMFMRSMRQMLDMEGRYEARQLEISELRAQTKTTSGFSLISDPALLAIGIKNTKKGLFRAPIETQLEQAGAAALFAQEQKRFLSAQDSGTIQTRRELLENELAKDKSHDAPSATLALSVLGLGHVLDLHKKGEMNDENLKAAVVTIKSGISSHCNLLSMQKSSNPEEGSPSQELREQIFQLCDAIKDSKNETAITTHISELSGLMETNHLKRRAIASLEMKDAHQALDKRIKSAVGSGESTKAVREYLTQYEMSIGIDKRITGEVGKQMGSNLKEELNSMATASALRLFQQDLESKDFSEYFDKIGNEQSPQRHKWLSMMSATLQRAEKGQGGQILSKNHADAVAVWVADSFIEAVKETKQPLNDWLIDSAKKHQASESRQIKLLTADQGAEAGRALDKAFKDISVERLVQGLKPNSAVGLSSFSKGELGTQAQVSGVGIGATLKASVGNDLTVSLEGNDEYSVYLGRRFMAEIGASAGIDILEQASAEIGLEVGGEYAKGIKLNFGSREECTQFLSDMLSGTEKETEKSQKALSMLESAEKCDVVVEYGGKIELHAEVKAQLTLGTVMGELTKVPAVATAVKKAEQLSDTALTATADTAKKAAGAVVDELEGASGLETGANTVISGISAEDTAQSVKSAVAEKAGEKTTEAAQFVIDKVKGESEPKSKEDEAFSVSVDLSKPEEDKGEDKGKEDDGDSFVLFDAAASASLAVSGARKTHSLANGVRMVETSVRADLSAGFESHVLGANLFEASVERNGTISRQKTYTGSELTDVKIVRAFDVSGGKESAERVGKFLKSFGVVCEAMIDDVSKNDGTDFTVEVNTQMTKSGMERYKALVAEGKTFEAEFALMDRRNYELETAQLQITPVKAKAEASAAVDIGLEGAPVGSVKIGFSKVTEGSRTRSYTYYPTRIQSEAEVTKESTVTSSEAAPTREEVSFNELLKSPDAVKRSEAQASQIPKALEDGCEIVSFRELEDTKVRILSKDIPTKDTQTVKSHEHT